MPNIHDKKSNRDVKKLLIVVSIIYNKKPFSYSFDVNDYFETKELAKQYAFSTQFVDLAKLSDDEILCHRGISGLDLVFKCDIDQCILDKITANITRYDNFVV